MEGSIGINEFVLRQVKDSPYAYFDGSFEKVVEMAKFNFDFGNYTVTQEKDGKPRVVLVRVWPVGFYSSIVRVNEDTKLSSSFARRREEEEGYIKCVAEGGFKSPAHFVNLVLYSHDALSEKGENSTNCEWELISINASDVENEPMHPLTMARNFLEKVGGTKSEYSAEQFAESIWYWKDKVLCK